MAQQNQRFEDRERLNSELFGVYIDGRNRTDALIEKNNTDHFNLYKYTRDADDDIRKELSDLKAELAVTKAIRPYQDKLIQCEMEKMFTAGINYTDRKTCIGNVKEVIKDYIIKQLVSMGESSPAIRLLIPLAKRAITNNINSFDKFLKPIADKDGMIDIEGIFDEEMEVINNIDNFDFDIPFIGGGNISKGIISLEVPYVNKIVALNQTDLEVLKESLISLKTK